VSSLLTEDFFKQHEGELNYEQSSEMNKEESLDI